MKITLTPVVLILCAVVLSACSGPLRMHVQQNRYELPEITGQKKLALDISEHFDEYSITFTERISDYPVDTETPKIEKVDPDSYEGSDTELELGVRYGINDQVEISGSLGNYLTLSAKMKLSGKPRSEAVAGNFSTAISAAFSASKNDDDGDFEDDGNTIDSSFWDASLLGGYRITDSVLIYSSLFYTKYEYDIHVEPLSINQNRTRFSGDAEVNGINVGVNIDINRYFYITLETLRSTLKTGKVDESESFYGLNLGFRN